MRAKTRDKHAGVLSGRRRTVGASVLVAAVALTATATMGAVSAAGAATPSLGQRVIALSRAAALAAPAAPTPQVTGLPPISKVTTASGGASSTIPQASTTSSGISATYSGTTLTVLWDTGNSLTVSGAGPLGAGSTVVTPNGSIVVGGSNACSSAGGFGVVSINQFAVDGSGTVTTLALQFACLNSTLTYADYGTVGLNVDPGTRTPGYNLFEANGAVTSFGATSVGPNVTLNFGVGIFGDATGLALNQPIVGMATTPLDGGYWAVAGDGGVFSFGDASFHGSTGNLHLNKPVVGMAATPDGKGYWFVASDGGIFSYGDAAFHGSTGNLHLNKPIVGMAATPDGKGYWLVASDGGIFSFGDARFHGSTGNLHLNKPIVGMAVDQATGGYWLVAADGGIFSFGAPFFGSAGALHLNSPIVGMTTSADAKGYWFTASDGGVFSYGDAAFGGSLGGGPINDVVGMAR